jgi:DNA-directed RNA polymerase subunit RPC12/RpoP
LAETIDVDNTPDSCYQYAIKTMQRLGAVPTDQDPPVAFDFRFVETGDRGSIFVRPALDGTHSSVTVCLGAKSQPEQTQRMRGLAKQIIVEMNPPEAVTVRHTGEVVQYSIATSFSLDSNGALLIRCPHCGAQRPKADRDREVKCPNCGQTYLIPQKLLQLI